MLSVTLKANFTLIKIPSSLYEKTIINFQLIFNRLILNDSYSRTKTNSNFQELKAAGIFCLFKFKFKLNKLQDFQTNIFFFFFFFYQEKNKTDKKSMEFEMLNLNKK